MCGFIFIHLKVFSNLLLDFFFDPLIICSVLFHFHISLNFSLFFFLLLISNFIQLYTSSILCKISVFLNVLKFVLWTNKWPTLENIPYTLEKNIYSAVVGWVFCKCLSFLMVYNVVQVFRFLVDLSSCSIRFWKWGIEVTDYYCWIVISPFNSVSFASCLWGFIVRYANIYNYVFLVDWHFLS